MLILKQPVDHAEDIVYGWHSATRGMHIYDKGVIQGLQARIVKHLVKIGKDETQAVAMAKESIIAWAEKNEHRDCSDPESMNSLVEYLERIFR